LLQVRGTKELFIHVLLEYDTTSVFLGRTVMMNLFLNP